MRNLKKMVASFIAGAIIFSGLGAYAATSIKVDVLPLKFYFDGVQKKPSGNQMGFVYEGTTYVPLRFMAESLGKEVAWDSKTTSIYVGKKPDNIKSINTDFTYITELKPYGSINGGVGVGWTVWTKDNNYVNKVSMQNTMYSPDTNLSNNNRSNTYTYYLNKGYSKLTGILGVDDSSAGSGLKQNNFYIYGDGKLIYGEEDIIVGEDPINVEVNLKGVNKLEIKFSPIELTANNTLNNNPTNFAEVKLYK